MPSPRFWPGLLVLTAAWGGPLLAADEADVVALARRIDERIEAGLAGRKVGPAPDADDAEFLRRAYLDLAGRIPSVAEARAFLADQSPGKRVRLVEELLASPQHLNHFTTVWRKALLVNANAQQQAG